MICDKVKECTRGAGGIGAECVHKKDHPSKSSCIPPCPGKAGGVRGAKCIPPITEANKILNEDER